MSTWRILLLLILVAKWSVVNAERLGGEAFSASGSFWQSVPPGWSQQPITPEVDVQDADLAITLDQQLYPYLLPVIEAYAMVRMVAADPKAIGYETLWMVRQYQAMGQVRPLRLNGVSPDDADALAHGRYPLYRVYNVTTWEGVAGKALARDLISHLFDSTQALDNSYAMVPASRLRAHGWRFEGDELVGEPESIASRGSQAQIKELVLLPGIQHAP